MDQISVVDPEPRPSMLGQDIAALLQLFERNCQQLIEAMTAGNSNLIEEVRATINELRPSIIGLEDDRASIAAVKSFELLSWPVPRYLYIVQQRGQPLCKRLRLHLLCECSIQDYEIDPPESNESLLSDLNRTLGDCSDDSQDNTLMHDTNHPGYEILYPTDFCKTYGPHLLSVMKCLHFGAIVAGIVVPGLSAIHEKTWYSKVHAFLNYNNQSVSEPWLKVMQFVASLSDPALDLRKLDDDMDMMAPTPLEGECYRAFQEFLNRVDRRRSYGNLVPVFSHEDGHLKWMCKDHTRVTHNGRTLLSLLEATAIAMNAAPSNLGDGDIAYLDRLRKELRFRVLHDEEAMKKLYDALQNAPGITTVDVHLKSSSSKRDLSKRDLEMLWQVLTNTNLTCIILNGRNLDPKIAKSSHHAILTILLNRRCQNLSVIGFKDFLSSISGLEKLQATYRMRTLRLLDSDIGNDNTVQRKNLMAILKLCPVLRNLAITTVYNGDLLSKIREQNPLLKHLCMISPLYDTGIKINQNKDPAIDVLVKDERLQLDRAIYPLLKIVRIKSPNGRADKLKDWLENLVKTCPLLQAFDIRISLRQFHDMVNVIQGALQSVTNNGMREMARIFQLRPHDDEHEVTMVVHWQGHLPPDINVDVELVGKENSNEHLESIFFNYGSRIRVLAANELLNGALLGSFCAAVRVIGSKLVRLNVNPSGLNHRSDYFLLQELIQRSPNLKEFTLTFSSLQEDARRENAKAFLGHYGAQITGLVLEGRGCLQGSRLHWLSKMDLRRIRFGSLQHLEIDLHARVPVDDQSAECVLQLMSAPEAQVVPIPPLQFVSLRHFTFLQDHWNRILSHLDLNALKHLNVEDSNFGENEMRMLIARLPRNTLPLPLKEIVIRNTNLVKTNKMLAFLETKMLERAPGINVIVD
ncbi:hypothetical protein BGZ92_001819 [Podila epicladia]|nr:hypothetical protein BGZ92_001819 [Podila epicladia]